MKSVCCASPWLSPTLFILVTRSPSSLMASTCSLRYSPSTKSVICASPWLSAFLWSSSRLWFTVLSSSRASSTASRAFFHSVLEGFSTSLKTTFPLQLQGVLHGLKGILPLRLGGLFDILEDNLSSPAPGRPPRPQGHSSTPSWRAFRHP